MKVITMVFFFLVFFFFLGGGRGGGGIVENWGEEEEIGLWGWNGGAGSGEEVGWFQSRADVLVSW